MNFSNTENFKLSNLWPFGCNSKHKKKIDD